MSTNKKRKKVLIENVSLFQKWIIKFVKPLNTVNKFYKIKNKTPCLFIKPRCWLYQFDFLSKFFLSL